MYIKAKVTADAKKEVLGQVAPDHFKISVREPAKQNLANTRVIDLLAGHFSIPRGKVRLISGHHSPSKLFSVDIEKK